MCFSARNSLWLKMYALFYIQVLTSVLIIACGCRFERNSLSLFLFLLDYSVKLYCCKFGLKNFILFGFTFRGWGSLFNTRSWIWSLVSTGSCEGIWRGLKCQIWGVEILCFVLVCVCLWSFAFIPFNYQQASLFSKQCYIIL